MDNELPARDPAAFSRPAQKPIVLARRVSPLQRAQEANEASAEARRSIDAIMALSRAPWGEAPKPMPGDKVLELEKALRALEAKLAERDIAVAEAEHRLADFERDRAEMEALQQARDRVRNSARRQPAVEEAPLSKAQEEALQRLKVELDRQEQSLREQRAAYKDREDFLEQSETALFSKMQQQQERETELEQLEEEMHRKMRQLGLMPPEPPEPAEKA